MASYYANIEGDTWAEKLQVSTACKCCDRHSKNKPVNLAPWINTPLTGNVRIPSDCKCKCRHNARFICRVFDMWECPPYGIWKNCTDNLSDGYLTD
jgi:hypothetical protein